MAALKAHEKQRLRDSLYWPLVFTALAWIVYFLNIQLISQYELDLRGFGIRPFTDAGFAGLIGVVVSPFLHGDFEHLFSNSAPLIVLGFGVFYLYRRAAGPLFAAVWLGSGLGVWIFGRPGPHIGASGLVYGLAAFVFLSGVLRREKAAIALALIAAFLYGSMVWGVFPQEPGISWEAHASGAVIGLLVSVIHRLADPGPQQPLGEDADDEREPLETAIARDRGEYVEADDHFDPEHDLDDQGDPLDEYYEQAFEFDDYIPELDDDDRR